MVHINIQAAACYLPCFITQADHLCTIALLWSGIIFHCIHTISSAKYTVLSPCCAYAIPLLLCRPTVFCCYRVYTERWGPA